MEYSKTATLGILNLLSFEKSIAYQNPVTCENFYQDREIVLENVLNKTIQSNQNVFNLLYRLSITLNLSSQFT